MINSKTLYFLFSFLFIFLPISFFGVNDFWDGVSVSYAFETKNNIGLDSYMKQGSYFVQFNLYKIFFKIAEDFNISYKYLINIFYVIIIYLLANELENFSKIVLRLKNFFSILPGIILIIFPIWSVLISSIFISHLLSVLFIFIGSRLFFNKNFLIRSFSLLLIIISFELKSNFLFGIVLIFAYELRKNSIHNLMNYVNTLFIIFFNIFLFLIFKIFLPPSGLWEGHNQIINILNWYNIKHFIWHALLYSQFYIPLLISNFLLFFFLKKLNFIKIVKEKNFFIFLTLLIMNISSMLPYLAVLKATKIFDYNYSPRYAFLLAPAFALLFSYNFNFYFNKLKNTYFLKFNIIIFIFFFSMSSLYLFAHKYNYLKFRDNLISELRLINIESGKVVLNGDNIPSPIMITKESNYIFWKAYGESRWATHILKDRNIPMITTERFFTNNGKYVYLAQNFKMKCTTRGEILTEDYSGFQNILHNLFNSDGNRISLKNIKKICN